MNGSMEENCSQDFLDEMFSEREVLIRGRIYGLGSVTHGGRSLVEDVCTHLHLKPGQKLLDIGCGNGDNDFYVARQYKADILGVDLSKSMIAQANKTLRKEDQNIRNRISFKVCDALQEDFGESSFDAALSRDVFMYIAEKKKLTEKIQHCLKDGGRLVMTDFCRGEGELSTKFEEYFSSRGCHLLTIEEYKELFRSSGFTDVQTFSEHNYFLNIVERELRNFAYCEEAFVQDFSQEEFDNTVERWKKKLEFAQNGEFRWVCIHASCQKN